MIDCVTKKAIREGLDKTKVFITGQFHLSNIFYNFKV